MAKFFRRKKSEFLQRVILRSSLLFLLLVLSGCALKLPEPPPPVVTTIPEPEPTPPIDDAPVAQLPPIIRTPAVPEPVSARVAIVLSDSKLAYTNISLKLLPFLEDYQIYELADGNRSARQVFAAIADSNAQFVVAIGLNAAKLAKSFATVPVIFSQVFNVQENRLVSDMVKGVAVLPPLDLQVEAWREDGPEYSQHRSDSR